MLQLDKFLDLRTTNFAFKLYKQKEKVFFEILTSIDERFVCKLNPNQFDDLVDKVEVTVKEKEDGKNNYYFFDKTNVKEDISIYEIIHDAVPETRFFHKHENSKYNTPERMHEYPIGLSGGVMILTKKNPALEFALIDFNEKVSGEYILKPINDGSISIKRLNDVVKNTL